MRTIWGSVALLLCASAATAATVTVDGNTIRVSGDFDWTAGAGYVDPVRASATYAIELPIAGTPFDPSFTPPLAVRQQVPPAIGHGLPVIIGDPQTQDVERAGAVSAQVFNWHGPRMPILRPDNAALDPQPELTDQYIGLGGLRYVTDSPNGTSNVTYMNFFLNFNEDYSELLSVSATQVIESSIFIPLPDGESISELGVLVALGVDTFEPIPVEKPFTSQ
ncbi:MAG: hypothetical protein AAF771_00845 [Pseudomonadota bacterium]